jgi:uncharacterized protein YecE (DUF72 family)
MALKHGAGQLDLFPNRPPPPPPHPGERPWDDTTEQLGRGLHPLLHLGTSSWTFPGWGGLCYPRGIGEAQLQRDGLALYTRYPLFRTVGLDRSHYKPLTRDELEHYAAQLPPGFTVTEKVWDRLLMPAFPLHPRYGIHAGAPNPSFLDAALFHDAVHAPHVGVFEPHLGCYLLEFPPMAPAVRPPPELFAARLARFLDALPYGPRFAVELRNRELLTPAYLDVLRRRNVAHVYSWWAQMPSIREQLALAPPTADFLVARLMLKPGTTYEARKAAFAPFDRLHEPSEELRADVEELARVAIELGRVLRVIVNNKAEGSAPLTVLALAERLQRFGRGFVSPRAT